MEITLQIQFYISYVVFIVVIILLIIWLSILSHQIRMLSKTASSLQKQLDDLKKSNEEEKPEPEVTVEVAKEPEPEITRRDSIRRSMPSTRRGLANVSFNDYDTRDAHDDFTPFSRHLNQEIFNVDRSGDLYNDPSYNFKNMQRSQFNNARGLSNQMSRYGGNNFY